MPTPGDRAGCVGAFLLGIPTCGYLIFHEKLYWGIIPDWRDGLAVIAVTLSTGLIVRWIVNRISDRVG